MIDLHSHSLFSDGTLLPSELIRRAEVQGYRYWAITDHVDISNIDLVVPRLVAVARELNTYRSIKMLPGIELTHVPPRSCLATTDVGFVASFLLAMLALRRALNRPTLISMLLLGAATGLAIATKFSTLVFLPPAAAAVVALPLLESPRRAWVRTLGNPRPWRALAAVAIAAVLVTWGCYRFRIGRLADLPTRISCGEIRARGWPRGASGTGRVPATRWCTGSCSQGARRRRPSRHAPRRLRPAGLLALLSRRPRDEGPDAVPSLRGNRDLGPVEGATRPGAALVLRARPRGAGRTPGGAAELDQPRRPPRPRHLSAGRPGRRRPVSCAAPRPLAADRGSAPPGRDASRCRWDSWRSPCPISSPTSTSSRAQPRLRVQRFRLRLGPGHAGPGALLREPSWYPGALRPTLRNDEGLPPRAAAAPGPADSPGHRLDRGERAHLPAEPWPDSVGPVRALRRREPDHG